MSERYLMKWLLTTSATPVLKGRIGGEAVSGPPQKNQVVALRTSLVESWLCVSCTPMIAMLFSNMYFSTSSLFA
eukprot:11530276-Prorocentrum_lima.AAC.1